VFPSSLFGAPLAERVAVGLAVVSLVPPVLLAGAFLLGVDVLLGAAEEEACTRCRRRMVSSDSLAAGLCGVCRWDDVVLRREA
jgi:hypothetical protein